MTVPVSPPIDVDLGELRQAIQTEYAEVALHPAKGFHFHTGRPLARLLGYADAWLVGTMAPHTQPPQSPVDVPIAPDRAAAEPKRLVA